MGHGRYLLFFLLCGIASVFAQTISNPQSVIPMVGASGAISGVLGAYIITYPKARILTLVPIVILFYIIELPAYFFLGMWVVSQPAPCSCRCSGVRIGSDLWCHLKEKFAACNDVNKESGL
jgi:membrane associated rhomboid family serine protease